MSGKQEAELADLGWGAQRVAQALLVSKPLPNFPKAINGLLTDPASRFNAMLAPLTRFQPEFDRTAPSQPEAAEWSQNMDRAQAYSRPVTTESAAEWSQREPLAMPFVPQAENGMKPEVPRSTFPNSVMSSTGKLASPWNVLPTDARTVMPFATNTLPSLGSPFLSLTQGAEPEQPVKANVALSVEPGVSLQKPMQQNPMQAAADKGLAQTSADKNPVSPDGLLVAPDGLEALRFLTTTARTKTALPFSVTLDSTLMPPTTRAAVSASEAFIAPDAGGLRHDRQKGSAFSDIRPLPLVARTKPSAETDAPASPPPLNEISPPHGRPESLPLRLMQGVTPLSTMLQAHVRPAPTDGDFLSALPDITDLSAPLAVTPPGPLRSAPFASNTAPGAQTPASTLRDRPRLNLPPVSDSPYMDALIQALESHLELEFLRAYGTSGRG